LLDGNYNGTFQVGSNGDDANERIAVDLRTATVGNLTGEGLLDDPGVDTVLGTGDDIKSELVDSTPAGLTAAARIAENVTVSQAAIEKLDTAISKVSDVRAQLGATQNRFEHTINNLNVSIENLSASESRIVLMARGCLPMGSAYRPWMATGTRIKEEESWVCVSIRTSRR
uniref:flagellin n=1 Tax=Spirillospora albida TaxID=58123 RepID=UPI002480BFBC